MRNFLYYNYLPHRGCFYTGGDLLGVCDEVVAVDWHEKTKQHLKVIDVKRPRQDVLKIHLPVIENDVEEDSSIYDFIAQKKVESIMSYVIQEILKDYYFGIDECFHPRKQKTALQAEEEKVVFIMREMIDGIYRTSPIKIKTHYDKESKQVSYTDWNPGIDVFDAGFTHEGEKLTTNFFGVYTPVIRKTIMPNSNFNGNVLQSRQRDAGIKRGRITIMTVSRSGGKSYSNVAFVASYIFKQINLPHEFSRPFLIIYGGLSKTANMNVVDYLKAMCKSITTSKDIMKWNAEDQVMTFYDGTNERKIKFVTQGQEGGGFLGSRPHLVILDEASRMDESMWRISAATAEAHFVVISTINRQDKKGWFYKLYLEGVKQMSTYEDASTLIKRLRVENGLHKIKTRQERDKKVEEGCISRIRDQLWAARPIVSLKYTIDDVEYLTQAEKDRMIASLASTSEEDVMAEYYCEYVDNQIVFKTDGRIDRANVDRYDCVGFGFDEGGEFDNAAAVLIGMVGKKAYVIESMILNSDFKIRYEQLNELYRRAQSLSDKVIFSMDISQSPQSKIREAKDFLREPDYPVHITSSQDDEIRRVYPKYTIGKKALVKLCQEQFFRTGLIFFDEGLDVEHGLLEELENFVQVNGKIEGRKGKKDDQVNAMMVALMGLSQSYMTKYSLREIVMGSSIEDRYDAKVDRARLYSELNELNAKITRHLQQFR